MSKRDVMLFLFKWKYSLVGYFVFVVAAAVAFVYLLPQKYDASASVLIESNRAPVMRSNPVLGIEEISVLNSEMAIIRSRTVLGAAVDKVGIGKSNEPPSTIELWLLAAAAWMEEVGLRQPRTPRESMIEALEDDLDVEPVPASNVILLSLRGKSPQATAALVNAVTDAYIAQHLRIFSSVSDAAVLRQQLARLGQDLDARRKELQLYKKQGAVYALPETRQALARLQGDLVLEINRARAELAEARSQFGANHTRVGLAHAKLANFERELKQTADKLKGLEAQEGRVREMEVGIASLEKSYSEFQSRYEEQRLDTLANPDVVNVRVIEYAEVPTRPGHSRLFYIVLAAAGGLLLSVVIALIREYFDHRVNDPDRVQHLLGVPTLGSLERA
jgi:uncharacterized protein involved in exopolysaccharide biosynthesis